MQHFSPREAPVSHIQTQLQKQRNVSFFDLRCSHLSLVSSFKVRKRVKLEGKELEEYLEKDKIKKEAAKKLEQAKE